MNANDRAAHLAPLLKSGRLFFQSEPCRTDLLDPNLTSTWLVDVLRYLVIEKGWALELTCVRSGHHNDGPRGHYGGFAWDGWPLVRIAEGAWLAASDPRFREFLRELAAYPNLYQTGLAGEADSAANREAAGPHAFEDTGGDHVHCGVTDGSF